MNGLLLQSLGWIGFLKRPFVLEQLLIAGLVFALLAVLRRRERPLRRLSSLLVGLLGLLIAMALAAMTERRFGLLLLAWQILASFWALRLVEQLLLKRCQRKPSGIS